MIEPRPYQRAALAALRVSPWQRPLVAHATGLGKTILFAKWLEKRTGRGLVLAHRDELIQQAVAKLKMVSGIDAGIVKAERNDIEADLVVASVQTLARERRLQDLFLTTANLGRQFGRIVIDEAHHSEADTYQEIIKRLGCFTDGGPRLLGVTATPERGDGKALGKTWQGIVHHMSILDGIEQGYLANLRAMKISIKADFQKLRTSHGEIRDDDAEHALLEANAPRHIAQAIVEHAAKRPTLVFTPTVKASQAVRDACVTAGLSASHLDGTTPTEERRLLLRKFHEGAIQVLTNCGVLTEGYDEERIACIVMARPTKSAPFYIQCIGRGTRLHPDKEDCLILDVVGVTRQHDLVTADVLLTEDAAEGEPQNEDQPRRDHREDDTADESGPGGHLVAVPVDLFAARPFAWIKTHFGYVLDLGSREQGQVTLEETGTGWKVSRLIEQQITPVWHGSTLGYAQGIAEDYVRKIGQVALAKRTAVWRDDPMTEGQGRMLTAWRVPFSRSWSKGKASDAITQAIANATYSKARRAQSW